MSQKYNYKVSDDIHEYNRIKIDKDNTKRLIQLTETEAEYGVDRGWLKKGARVTDKPEKTEEKKD